MGIELQELQELTDREKILAFENILASRPGSTVGDSLQCPLKHSFADGIYVREIFIPKGCMLTGKIHKHYHPNFLMKGKVQVFTEHEGLQTLEAPLSMISKPGTKRIVYAIEDTVWITVHLNPENTYELERLEEYVIAKSFPEFEAFKKLQELTHAKGELCLKEN